MAYFNNAEITEKLSKTFDLENLLDYMGDLLAGLPIGNYGIYLCDDKKENLKMLKFIYKKELIEYQKTFLKTVNWSLSINLPQADCFNNNSIIELSKKDFSRYSEEFSRYSEQMKIEFAVFIPFSIDSKIIGVIQLISKNAISRETIKTVEEMISIFFYAVKNAEYIKAIESRDKESIHIVQKTENIFNLALQINNLLSLDKIYELIFSKLIEIYKFEAGDIWVAEGKYLKIEHGYSIDEINTKYGDKFNEITTYLEKNNWYNLEERETGLCMLYFGSHKFYINNFESVRQMLPLSPKEKKIHEILDYSLKTCLFIPIKNKNTTLGILCLYTYSQTLEISESDINQIEGLCSFIGSAIENSKTYTLVENQKKELEEKDKIIREDLMLAKRIQQTLIYPDLHKDTPLDYHILYLPQYEIGGDLYDIFKLDENTYRIFLADATGHGIQASLSTIIIKNEYDLIKNNNINPNEILNKLNQSFCQKYFKLTVFFTCIIMDINITDRKITFSSAGHPDQFLITDDRIKTLHSCGKLCGVFEDSSYSLIEQNINKTDKILLFTDGLFEQFNSHNEEFGEKRIFELINSNKNLDIRNLDEVLKKNVFDYIGNEPLADDMTMIVISLN